MLLFLLPTAPVNLKATASGANNLITWQKPYMTGLGEGVQATHFNGIQTTAQAGQRSQ